MGEFRFEFWVLSGGEADEITEFPENIKYFLSGDILSEVFKIERLFALFLFVFSRWSADFNRVRIWDMEEERGSKKNFNLWENWS